MKEEIQIISSFIIHPSSFVILCGKK